jgi:magnesium chelatase accessory protein
MTTPLSWYSDGRDWPHRQHSRFIRAGKLHWHVQRMGAGPDALLIHGTGSSTHSWRGLMPLLACHYTVYAMDLPGHAFTGTPAPASLSLPGMAQAIARLVEALKLDVSLVVGHSAGAAIGAHMALQGLLAPQALAAINGAFLPLSGLPGLIFPPVARLLAATPLAARLFAQRGWDDAAIRRLVGGTGSTLDAAGLTLYAKLVRNARHAAGALGMMAAWDLRALERDLASLSTPLVMVVGDNDRAVSPMDAQIVRTLLPPTTLCTLVHVPDAGHLAHEERPADVARLILSALDRRQGLPASNCSCHL